MLSIDRLLTIVPSTLGIGLVATGPIGIGIGLTALTVGGGAALLLAKQRKMVAAQSSFATWVREFVAAVRSAEDNAFSLAMIDARRDLAAALEEGVARRTAEVARDRARLTAARSAAAAQREVATRQARYELGPGRSAQPPGPRAAAPVAADPHRRGHRRGEHDRTDAGMTVTERAAEIAAEAAAATSGETSAGFAAIAARLGEPLRVAVTGPVKAGKSTLVNALLRQPVAPTDVSECTRVVTEFRYGYPQRAEVELLDGSTQVLPLRRGGQLPVQLGVDPSAVAKVRVWLANDVLRSMILIDTPGLNSANADISARSEQLLRMDADTRWALGGADVVIFVLTASLNATDIAQLRERYVTTTGSRSSALTTLGVLTKADQIGSSDDPWVAARTAGAASRRSARGRRCGGGAGAGSARRDG